jgi:hypothetical protein
VLTARKVRELSYEVSKFCRRSRERAVGGELHRIDLAGGCVRIPGIVDTRMLREVLAAKR